MAKDLSYSDAQIAFVVGERLAEKTWPEIAETYAKKFRVSPAPTAATMAGVFRRHAEASLSADHDTPHPYAEFTRAGIGRRTGKNAKRKATYFVMAVSPVNTLSPLREGFDPALGVRGNLFGPGFDAVLRFCRARKAELILLPLNSHLPAQHNRFVQHYDPVLWPYRSRFFAEFVFNENLRARELYLNPQQIGPLTGLRRLRGGKVDLEAELRSASTKLRSSLLIAHTKQDMETLPTGNSTTPRILQTTGVGTMPEYLPNRIGAIAEDDHILGGVVVEVDGPRFWHRQVQFDPETGSFCDIHAGGVTRYFADRDPAEERMVAFVPGDLHPGWHHRQTLDSWMNMMQKARPGVLVLDDWFDGASISHHLHGRPLAQMRLPEAFSCLDRELSVARALLRAIHEDTREWKARIVLRASNHPEHVVRYLEEGRYAEDGKNLRAAVRMLHHHLESGEHPLRKELDPEERFVWHKPNEDLIVEGVQLGAHGHLGPNGTKGSPKGLEAVYADAVTAHTHTPGIRHRTFTAGHCTVDRHGYNDGASSWLRAGVAVYRGGQKQLLVCLDGRYCL